MCFIFVLIARPFRFDKTNENRLYLHKYGLVTFNHPLSLNSTPHCRANLTSSNGVKSIAPFLADTLISGKYGGFVYYRLDFFTHFTIIIKYLQILNLTIKITK